MSATKTVRKVILEVSHCDLCEYERPYHEGDEDLICPACRGGDAKFWRTEIPSDMFPNDVGPSYLRKHLR